MLKAAVYLALGAVVGACGDDDGAASDTGGDAEVSETGGDTTSAPDGVDEVGPEAGMIAPPIALALSPGTPDQLQAAASAPDGGVYAVGFIAAGLAASDEREVVVVRLDEAGLDTTFAEAGIARTSLDFRGGTDELDIAIDGDGRIVISAVVANAAEPRDTDIAVLRLLADGSIDQDFADGGLRVLDLNAALIDGDSVTAGDKVRGLALDSAGRIYLHGLRRAPGEIGGMPRTDSDFSVVRLTEAGAVDESFAGGEFLLDLRGGPPLETPSSSTARGIAVLADGSVLAGGYAVTEGFGTAPQAVLYKLDESGALDLGFDGDGFFHDIVLSTQTEVYAFAVHGENFVTGGYGREAGDQNDWISLRFDLTTGARDTSWGGAPNGAVLIDPTGTQIGDNCRNAIALPGGRTLLIGSSGPGNSPEQDAALVVLAADGQIDASYDGGIEVVAFGDRAGNDQLWGGAVSGDFAFLVGYRGGGPAAEQTAGQNDDAYLVIMPLR